MTHLALILAVLGTAVSTQPSRSAPYEPVSLIRLISSPDKFNNKYVATSGIARKYEKETWILYLDCESAEAEIVENGIRLRVDGKGETLAVSQHMNMRFVLVQARFLESANGHFEDVDELTIYPLLRDAGEKDADVCKR